jgi:hypothetical protein
MQTTATFAGRAMHVTLEVCDAQAAEPARARS